MRALEPEWKAVLAAAWVAQRRPGLASKLAAASPQAPGPDSPAETSQSAAERWKRVRQEPEQEQAARPASLAAVAPRQVQERRFGQFPVPRSPEAATAWKQAVAPSPQAFPQNFGLSAASPSDRSAPQPARTASPTPPQRHVRGQGRGWWKGESQVAGKGAYGTIRAS